MNFYEKRKNEKTMQITKKQYENLDRKYGSNVIYPELSYVITGVLFEVHKELGCFEKEKHYGDIIAKKFLNMRIPFQREINIANTGNILDFIVDDKIVLELKSVRFITREYYRQIQNYLQQTRMKLGLLVNFRQKFLKPIRIILIDNQFSQ
jgi:GxxExxY protein